jgi:predicted MFS family arabinose efflux permease
MSRDASLIRLSFLIVGMFTLGFDAYVIAGLIPGVAATFGSTPSLTGQGITVFTLCYALSAPVFSALLAHGKVRRSLSLALAVFSAGNMATMLAGSLPLFLIGRGVAGIGAGLFSPLAMAVAVGIAGQARRGRALSLMLGGMSTGTVIGVPLGLLLADKVGWRGTMGLLTALGVLSLLGIALLLPAAAAPAPPSLVERIRMLADGRVLAIIGVTLLTGLAGLGLYSYVAPVAQAAGAADSVTAYLWVWGIGGMAGSVSIGYLIDRTGQPALLMAAMLGTLLVAVVLLPFVWHIPVLDCLPFLLWGAAGWAAQPLQQHMLISRQPDHAGTVVALNSSANYLGSAVGSALGGVMVLGGASWASLPFAAAAVIVLALMGHLATVAVSRKTGAIAKS